MRRAVATLLLIGLGLGASGGAMAQSERKVPVEQDLRHWDRNQDRLDERAERKAEAIGAVRWLGPNLDPVTARHVPGFDGPPGTVGDSVGSFGALPQGAAGADIR